TAHDTITLEQLARCEAGQPGPVVPLAGGGVAVGGGERTHWLDDRLRPTGPKGGRLRIERQLADGRVLAAGGGQVWVGARDGVGFELTGPNGASAHEAGAAAYAAAGGRYLLTASEHDHHARLWDPLDGQLMTHLVVAGGACRAAASPDGRAFVVLGEKGARPYEVRERREAGAVALQAGEVHTFALHEDGRTLATMAPGPGTDVADYGLHDVVGRAAPVEFRLPHPDPTNGNFQLRLAGPGHTLTRAGLFPTAPPVVWTERLDDAAADSRALTGRTLNGLTLEGGRYWAVADEALFGWGRDGAAVTPWRNALGEALTGKAALYAVAARGRRVAVACRDGRLRVFEDAGQAVRLVHEVFAGAEALTSVAVSADGRRAVAGSEGGEVIVFDLDAGAVLAREKKHEDVVTGVAFQPDGVLISGSTDGTIRLWRHDGDALNELAGLRHGRGVRRLELSPDGVTLYVLLAREHGVRTWHLGKLFDRFIHLGLGDGLPAMTARPLTAGPFAPAALPPTASGPGLRCELYRMPAFLAPVAARVDPAIDFNTHSGPLASGMLASPFSARWTGWLKAPSPGRYTVRLAGSTAMRLWLDGVKRIDLGPDGPASEFAFDAELGDGPHELRVEVSVSLGLSQPRLSWSKGRGKDRVIGPPHLFTDRAAALAK
ncbi:MAG: PA14 domain-containing protein, partial [Gemmataceae bacterium]